MMGKKGKVKVISVIIIIFIMIIVFLGAGTLGYIGGYDRGGNDSQESCFIAMDNLSNSSIKTCSEALDNLTGNCYYNAGKVVMSNCLDYFCGENNSKCDSNTFDEKGEMCYQILFKEALINGYNK